MGSYLKIPLFGTVKRGVKGHFWQFSLNILKSPGYIDTLREGPALPNNGIFK